MVDTDISSFLDRGEVRTNVGVLGFDMEKSDIKME